MFMPIPISNIEMQVIIVYFLLKIHLINALAYNSHFLLTIASGIEWVLKHVKL